jgi:homoserine dehydrogenase
MVNVAILGFGVVGSGVAELITKNSENIAQKTDDHVAVKYILDIRDFPESPFGHLIIHDFEQILNDPSVQIVAEVIGGTKPAYEFTKRALLAGKHVVTSNKELVATHGDELLQIARDKNVNYLFEATVGGGIPVIRPLNQCLAANEVRSIIGILNGTTNYILTQMIKEQESFEVALADAQKKGYAEANPAADIEGHDACRKIAILASLAFGTHINPDMIHTEGIVNITSEDVEYAQKDDRVIKLVGRCVKTGEGRLFLMVSPCLIKKSCPLASIEDVFNGILIEGDAVGEVMFYGRGAGKLPTASAVVADIIDAAKHFHRRRMFYWAKPGENTILDYLDFPTAFYLRVSCNDRSEALRKADSYFGHCHDIILEGRTDEIAFITEKRAERELLAALSEFEKEPSVSGILSKIRVMD